MHTLNTYLINLRNKVFKLLPMREAYDKGTNNHLTDYLENLSIDCEGAFDCYPELANIREIIEVRNNIAYLKNNHDIEFSHWRSVVLRSTRLVQNSLKNISEV